MMNSPLRTIQGNLREKGIFQLWVQSHWNLFKWNSTWLMINIIILTEVLHISTMLSISYAWTMIQLNINHAKMWNFNLSGKRREKMEMELGEVNIISIYLYLLTSTNHKHEEYWPHHSITRISNEWFELKLNCMTLASPPFSVGFWLGISF